MKKRSKLKKGLAILLSLAMVVGLVPGVGTMQVSAEESSATEETGTAAGITYTPLAGDPKGFSGEEYSNLLDGTADTKWCCDFTNPSYVIFKTSEPVYVNGYSIWTANDTGSESGRNPVAWTLSGCNDYDETNKTGGNWVTIHEVKGDNDEEALPAANKTEQSYSFAESKYSYQYFKLNITAIKDGSTMQLGDFSLTYNACEHQWVATGETIDPTCTEEGYDVYRCSLCQATKNEANGKSATGHTWVSDDVFEPTCTEEGYTLQTCSVCNATQKIEIKSALGHDFVNDGPCSRCGIMNTVPSKPAGDGTESSPYKISTVGELYWFAGLVSGDESVCTGGVTQNKSANAVLTADIIVNRDLLTSLNYDSGQNVTNGSDFTSWTSIGWIRWVGENLVDNSYTGTFDGQGHTVSGLYFNDTKIDNVGLFGYVGSGGSVSNVGIVDSYFNGNQDVGGVCGYNDGTITNCYNTGTVTGTNDNVGGVCGKIVNGTIANCYNTGTVSGKSICVGGVCGENYGAITNCHNIGKVSGQTSVGGVCGRIIEGTIANCYNTGAVSASASNPSVGGVCGNPWEGAIIVNCYYLEESETDGNDGKTTAQFKSGEVAYLLSQGCTIGEGENQIVYEGSCWGQKLGEAGDAYPVLKKTGDEGNTVYQNETYAGCEGNKGEPVYSYSNTQEDPVYEEHTIGEDGICSICNKKIIKVSLTSTVDGTEAEDTVALLTGGGLYNTGSAVTVTAPVKEGFTFKGWFAAGYTEGTALSTELSYTFTPEADTSLVAVYEGNETKVTTLEDAKKALQTSVLDRNSYIKLTLTGDALNDINTENVGTQGSALYTEAVKHIAAGEAGGNAKLGDYLAKIVGGYSLKTSYTTDESGLLSVTYIYRIAYYTDKAQEDAVDSRLSEIYTSLQLSDSTLTDAQKVWKIYDWITNHVTYDYENLNVDANKTKYTAYGALEDNKAVCQGFAGLFYRMCMDNGIDCRIVTGTASNGQSNEAHAWNIVRVGEAYYYVDATWDCKVLEDAESDIKAKPGTLYYFLRSSLDSHTESDTEKVTSGYPIAAKSLTGIQIEVPADVTKDTISSVVLKDLCGTALTEEQLAWYQVTVNNDTTDTCKWSVTVSPNVTGAELKSIVLSEETVYIHGGADENGYCSICNEIIDTYKHLQALITDVNAITQENYSDASYQTLQDALAAANTLTDTSTDAELTAAYEALDNAKNGLKTATVTVTTSSDPANSGILTGGGKYAVGETITLTAKAVSGYKFLGWYLDGTEGAVSNNTTYEISVTGETAEELKYIAKYEANEKKRLSVTVGNGTVAYSYQNGTQTGTWGNDFTDNAYAKGTYFTVTAQPNDGYTFLYWINSAGRVLTEAPEYSFYLGDNLQLRACYKKAVENQHYVIFKDMNGKVLWSGDVSMNQTEEDTTTKYGTVDLPSHGIFAGYTFKQWKDASGNVISTEETGTVKITEDIVIYADYEAVTGLKLTVDGVEQSTTYAYASKVTVTADESRDNKYFSGWYIGNKLVSDSREYTFYITGDTSLTAKYEGESVIVQKPIVNMTMSERATLENGKQTLVMNVNWSVPEGYTFVEGGLVRSLVDAYSDNLTLSDVDGTNVKKNVSKLTTAEGTYAYTLTLSTASVDKNVYAVGYITYKNDATGEVTTIYTDKFTSTAVSNGAGN